MSLSIQTYHRYLQENLTSCEQTVQSFLDRISRLGHLNAFVDVYADEALLKARELDESRKKGLRTGKLHGVVIALKDVICYENHRVTAASKMLNDFTSLYTAGAVQHLLDEEAIIIGTCNCDEFAMGSSNENSVYGPVKNALDISKVPGGSSGGSAVAVQADLCMVSLGSDTGGSVRQPADFCGIIGLKPGYGSVSRHGLIAYASSFDQIGVFGKYMDDVKLVYQTLSRPDPKDSTMLAHHRSDDMKPTGKFNKRIAVLAPALQHPSNDPIIRRGMDTAISQWQSNGYTVHEVDFPLLDYVVPAYYVMTAAEASSNLSRYDGVRYGFRSAQPADNIHDFYINNRTEGFGEEVKRRIMLGNFVLSSGYYDAYYSKAQQVRRMLVDKMNDILAQHDALLMPVSPTTAFGLGEKKKDPLSMYLADIYTVLANLTGVAAIAVPAFTHTNGMPFGFQMLMPAGQEEALMDLSDQMMKLVCQSEN